MGVLGVDIPDLRADQSQPREVKRGESDLNGPGIIDSGLRLKVDVEPLGQRFEPLYPLRTVKERRGPGDDEVETWKPARVYLVDQLPQGIQALVPHIASHPLDGLDLVEHQKHP